MTENNSVAEPAHHVQPASGLTGTSPLNGDSGGDQGKQGAGLVETANRTAVGTAPIHSQEKRTAADGTARGGKPRNTKARHRKSVSRPKKGDNAQLGTKAAEVYWADQKERDLEFQALLRKHHPEIKEGVCTTPGTAYPVNFCRPVTKHANSSMGGNFAWE